VVSLVGFFIWCGHVMDKKGDGKMRKQQQIVGVLLWLAVVLSHATALAAEPSGGAPAPSDQNVTLPKVVVEGAREGSYAAPNATTATKTDTPLQEIPASIQVIPRQVIEDQKDVNISEALENVSGVRMNQSLNSGNRFIIRGFANNGNIYRNGVVSTSTSSFRTIFDTSNLEAIEVLKGPAAVLYGRLEPGGMINLVTKRPLDTTAISLEQQFGSYSLYRTLWDATGPITQDKSLSLRFSGGYLNSQSFRDFNFTDRKVFDPSVTWRPTSSTQITVDVEVTRNNYLPDNGIPVIGSGPAPVPISRSYSDPNTPTAFEDKTYVGFNLDHKFNESWKLTNRFLGSYLQTDDAWANPTPAFGNPLSGPIMSRNIFGQTSYAKVWATNLDLNGKFNVAETKHQVLLGFDYTKSDTNYWTFGSFNNPNPALAINLYNPTYGIDPGVFAAARNIRTSATNFSNFYEQWHGLYLQDQVTVWNKLHVLAGGRYDWANVARGRAANFEAAAVAGFRHDTRFSPRGGVLYDLTPWLGIYGSYVTSFGANNGISIAGNTPFAPQIGRQKEVGLKTDMFDHRLNSTLAFYYLTRSNLLTPDLNNPGFSVPIGEQRSQGIEYDITGQVTKALNVIGSYAYTDTRVTNDNSGLLNNRLSSVPLHSGRLWLKYDLAYASPTLKGWSVGFGPYIASSQHGDIQNTFTLPGYVRLDGFAAYSWMVGRSRIIAQFTVRNMLNQTYYDNADQNSNVAPRNGVYPGEPLSVFGSLRMEF
jgi:iron complex outermembrane receptor protein